MSITIKSKNLKMRIGYADFFRLRSEVAKLIGLDVQKHYNEISKIMTAPISDRKRLFSEHDEATERLANIHKKYDEVFDFLYASDCGAAIPLSTVRKINSLIRDNKNRTDFAKMNEPEFVIFKDFASIVKDCLTSRRNLIWY